MDMIAEGLIRGDDGLDRCFWHGGLEDYRRYHDEEWGRPVTDDVRLFEKICLEGFQSGLSWLTILRKRDNFRSAFAGFDFHQVARFGDDDVARCLADAGIIRDDLSELESRLRMLTQTSDIIVTTGGASVGDHDLVQHLIVDGGVQHRRHQLDPAVQVARHPVGR